MSGLKLRFGGSDSETPKVDFSHLENNPNYKPEDTPTDEPTNDLPIDESVNTPSEPADVPADEPSDSIPVEEPVDTPPADEPVQPQVTDELIFSTLSEKLGREVNSYEDLVQAQAEELNPQLKEINDWSKRTGRPIEDFFKFQQDFSKVSDEEIARKFLQEKFPMFNEVEIAYKMQSMLPSDDDLEEDTLRKNMELKMFASEGRTHFDSLRQELNTPANNFMTDEVKQKVQAFDLFQEQLAGQKQEQQSYYEGLVKASGMSDKVKLKLSEELSIDYNISEEDRKAIPEFINSMPHWKNPDGSWNHQAVVNDALKIKNFPEMLKLAYEQGVNSGKSDIVKKENNITLDSPTNPSPKDGGKKRITIEGADKLFGSQGLKFRF